ncbi:hypothetical protein BH20CHL7_BH20CHL7_09370 [soil metagenome]
MLPTILAVLAGATIVVATIRVDIGPATVPVIVEAAA